MGSVKPYSAIVDAVCFWTVAAYDAISVGLRQTSFSSRRADAADTPSSCALSHAAGVGATPWSRQSCRNFKKATVRAQMRAVATCSAADPFASGDSLDCLTPPNCAQKLSNQHYRRGKKNTRACAIPNVPTFCSPSDRLGRLHTQNREQTASSPRCSEL